MRFDEMTRGVLEARDQVPLYYMLAKCCTVAFGSTEFALRSPSALIGTLNVALIYRLTERCRRANVGLHAAWILALNPFHVWFSRDARPYALSMALATAVIWCFLLALHEGRQRHWIALALVSALAYLTHYLGLAAGLVQLVVFVVTFRETYRAFRRWVPVQAVAIVPVAAWFIWGMLDLGFSGLRGSWLPAPSWSAPLATLWNFSLGYTGKFTGPGLLGLAPFAVALVGLPLAEDDRIWTIAMVASVVLPPVTALALSLVSGPSYTDRYLTICVPAYLSLVAAGLTAWRRPRLRHVLTLSLMTAMALATWGILSGHRLPKPDWRGAAGHVLRRSENSDYLLVDAKALYSTFYYVGHALPIERIEPGAECAALDDAAGRDGRTWFLLRDPLETVHTLDRVRPYNPYESGPASVAYWLQSHSDSIEQEWFLRGAYLALLK